MPVGFPSRFPPDARRLPEEARPGPTSIRSRTGRARSLWPLGVLLSVRLLASPAVKPPQANPSLDETDCRPCHDDAVKAWASSHHALAQVAANEPAVSAAFAPGRSLEISGVHYDVSCLDGAPQLSERRAGQPPRRYVVAWAIGHLPLRQYIVPTQDGRFQATEVAYDPKKEDWFNVFGNERRQPGEWGHWLGRGMNWNSMCAACHTTRFEKHYDPDKDTYHSSWSGLGIGCVQCHGELPASHSQSPKRVATPPERAQIQETCAPCHARNEFLTGEIRPGQSYSDGYRLTLPTDPALFYPDGQMRDEDFNYTSFLASRMGGKAGVTCLDCHDPHTGKTVLPVADNQLCLQCHSGSGRLNAPPIDPVKHSHHAAGSTGNLCVSCHMPTTVYMQRDPRHDHGFLRPDPLMTKEAGIPNACNRCHVDKSVDWAIGATSNWYGAGLDSRQRQRTRVVIRAQAEAPDGAEALREALAREDIPVWRATLVLLSRSYESAALTSARQTALADPEPMVRSAAVQALGDSASTLATVRPSLHDPSRLVRLDAEWALSAELSDGSAERRELDRYLAVAADQPAGRLRLAQDLFNRGHADSALAPLAVALSWDPASPVLHDTLATVLESLGREGDAAAEWWRESQLLPQDDQAALKAGLAFAGANRVSEAERALRTAIERNPRADRAWYNLGLLLSQAGRTDEALGALRKAESLAPGSADYPYALATVLIAQGRAEEARWEVRKALEIEPGYAPAQALLHRLAPGSRKPDQGALP